MTTIWDPISFGTIELEHRLALAPMTRSRANLDGTPGALAAEYYAQRASIGLLITEGTQPSDVGQGYSTTPGIYTDAQVQAWRPVFDGVHARGGSIFVQLMHAGRIAHPDNSMSHAQPVAPSAVAPDVEMFTAGGMQPIPVPHALTVEEIAATVDDFRHAAACAVEAGADGVELHGANGYLLQQFLAPNANVREDQYGGSIENRIRFVVEVATAVADEIGPERTGIRLSPGGNSGDLDEGPESADLYRALVPELAKLDLAYLHLMFIGSDEQLTEIRADWPNTLIVNRPGRPLEQLGEDVELGRADIMAVGARALANPDFVERLRTGAELNAPDPSSFFGGGAEGYVDYPTLSRS